MKYSDFELVYMVRENEEAFNYMVKKYEPLYWKLANTLINKFPNKGLDKEDLVQQCRIAMCYAIERFNPDNDVLFYSYMLICVKRAMYNYARSYINKPDYYYYMNIEGYDNMDEFVDSLDLDSVIDTDFWFSNVIKFKHQLEPLESWIFELRCNGFSYKEIAKLLEIEVKKVDNSLLKIRKKMEKYFLF